MTVIQYHSAFLVLILSAFIGASLDGDQLAIVIISQKNSYNSKLASALKESILIQSQSSEKKPSVKIIPEDLSHVGAWTILPILPRLSEDYGNNTTWIYFCEDFTVVNLKRLLEGLSDVDPDKAAWVGHALYDEEPTIIHHFAFAHDTKEFKYPMFPAGFALSSKLIKKIVNIIEEDSESKSDFSIDAAHELAMHLGLDNQITHLPQVFCLKENSSCASYPGHPPACEPPLDRNEVFIAVKTCEKFHLDRVPIVMQTWGQQAELIEFFSDVQNNSIPTTGVGIMNTERGHCSKTMEILKLSLNRLKKLKTVSWVVLVDDDTIISIPRLLSVLACYDDNTVLGERYGFNVKHNNKGGYNYITGGGGIAFGVGMLESATELCHCPAPDAPDDMLLGACFTTYQIPMIHSPLFHQARPMDYASGMLETQAPVSFHKHWMLDPISVYKKWFSHLDISPHSSHEEL